MTLGVHLRGGTLSKSCDWRSALSLFAYRAGFFCSGGLLQAFREYRTMRALWILIHHLPAAAKRCAT
jgi:hypothetical protein